MRAVKPAEQCNTIWDRARPTIALAAAVLATAGCTPEERSLPEDTAIKIEANTKVYDATTQEVIGKECGVVEKEVVTTKAVGFNSEFQVRERDKIHWYQLSTDAVPLNPEHSCLFEVYIPADQVELVPAP